MCITQEQTKKQDLSKNKINIKISNNIPYKGNMRRIIGQQVWEAVKTIEPGWTDSNHREELNM